MTSCFRAAAIRVWPAVILLLAGCAPEAPPPPPPPQVVVTTPTQRDVTNYADFTGNTQAIQSVEIRARVQGFLEQVTFEPSSFVRTGQLLFVIERDPYIAAKDRAEADVLASEAALRRTESDLERLEEAVKTHAVSQQEVTRARAERDQAQAALLAAKAVLANVEIDLRYTKIRSPINGIISRRYVDRGNLVGGNQATLLAEVYNVDPIYVYFEVNEQVVAKFLDDHGGARPRAEDVDEERFPVYVTVDGVDREFQGYLDYIDPATDPDTGTVQMRAVVPNEDARLLPGFFVRIRVPGELMEGALLVEETALSTDLGGRYLLLVDDESVVQKRYVEPGALQEDGLRVVLDGLATGERYIVKGLQRARPSLPVTPQPAGAETTGGAP